MVQALELLNGTDLLESGYPPSPVHLQSGLAFVYSAHSVGISPHKTMEKALVVKNALRGLIIEEYLFTEENGRLSITLLCGRYHESTMIILVIALPVIFIMTHEHIVSCNPIWAVVGPNMAFLQAPFASLRVRLASGRYYPARHVHLVRALTLFKLNFLLE
jgi:hypothetical protein